MVIRLVSLNIYAIGLIWDVQLKMTNLLHVLLIKEHIVIGLYVALFLMIRFHNILILK